MRSTTTTASHTSFTSKTNLCRLGLIKCPKAFLPSPRPLTRTASIVSRTRRLRCYFDLKVSGLGVARNGCYSRRRAFRVRAMDDDSVGVSSLHDWDDINATVQYIFSSSDGEDSDGDFLPPITDVDTTTTKEREQFHQDDDSVTLTTHRPDVLARQRKKRKTLNGVLNNTGVITFSIALLSLVDLCAWRIVRLPLAPFYLIRPFLMSAFIVSCAGYICVPLLRGLKLQAIIRRGPARHASKKGTPTMGGLYFIPLGILVAEVVIGFSSVEVSAASAVTLAFAAVGLLDDFISINHNNNGLSAWMRILLEVALGAGFSFWMCTTDISSPYSMKTVVPLPAPLGLVCLGKFYPLLTSFCFVSMANGINLTDGLDGLAGGTAALAFIAMSIVVLPICSDLAVFGTSMAGACVGFLMHNRYKASVFMGDTGALALGGALAAMAASTGMFFPLLISSGVFVLETVSVIMQVSFFKTSKKLWGTARRLFRMAPLHHHLELCGLKEPFVVAGAYIISCALVLCAGYIGLISV